MPDNTIQLNKLVNVNNEKHQALVRMAFQRGYKKALKTATAKPIPKNLRQMTKLDAVLASKGLR
jgi:hypothetical protein